MSNTIVNALLALSSATVLVYLTRKNDDGFRENPKGELESDGKIGAIGSSSNSTSSTTSPRKKIVNTKPIEIRPIAKASSASISSKSIDIDDATSTENYPTAPSSRVAAASSNYYEYIKKLQEEDEQEEDEEETLSTYNVQGKEKNNKDRQRMSTTMASMKRYGSR